MRKLITKFESIMLFTKKTTNNKTNTITLKYTDSCTTNSKKKYLHDFNILKSRGVEMIADKNTIVINIDTYAQVIAAG